MLEQLTQTAVQYIDTAMVGSLGTEATAAVGATSTVNWMIGSVVAAVGVGFLAFIARQVPVWMQVDAGIRDLAARYFMILYLPMLFRTASILFGMVLRSAGDSRTPMRVGLVVNGLNILSFHISSS